MSRVSKHRETFAPCCSWSRAKSRLRRRQRGFAFNSRQVRLVEASRTRHPRLMSLMGLMEANGNQKRNDSVARRDAMNFRSGRSLACTHRFARRRRRAAKYSWPRVNQANPEELVAADNVSNCHSCVIQPQLKGTHAARGESRTRVRRDGDAVSRAIYNSDLLFLRQTRGASKLNYKFQASYSTGR